MCLAVAARGFNLLCLAQTLTISPNRLKERAYPTCENFLHVSCPDGGIGRRTSFRCWRWQRRGGSSPLPGTIFLFSDDSACAAERALDPLIQPLWNL